MDTSSVIDVAEHETALAETYARRDHNGVAVVDGHGCTIRVEKGGLEIRDGVGPHRRLRRYERATHGLSRVVALNCYGGALSFDAARWCQKLGIGVVLVGGDGTPYFETTPRVTDDARLRRAQAMAPDQPVGLGISRYLLSAKVRGQAGVVRKYFGELTEAEALTEMADAIETAETVDECRQLEAGAALRYFGAWEDHPATAPRFVAKDRSRVPEHWGSYTGRRSLLKSASANRGASDPTNCLLNYLFSLLEAEAIFALHAVGLDPGLGIVHQDARGRQSMALDLLEPVRPMVEALVLDMVGARTWKKAEFSEDAEGHCRLRAPLTHELAEMMPRLAQWLAPFAEKVAHMLGAAMAGRYVPTTPLTSTRTKAAQQVVIARKGTRRVQRPVRRDGLSTETVPIPLYSCPDCGAPVTNPRHVLCTACQALAGHTPAVRQSRGKAISSRKAALKALKAVGTDDPDLFRRDIFPLLGAYKLSEIMAVTGYSKGYSSNVRAGEYAPAVSTWPGLLALVSRSKPGS